MPTRNEAILSIAMEAAENALRDARKEGEPLSTWAYTSRFGKAQRIQQSLHLLGYQITSIPKAKPDEV